MVICGYIKDGQKFVRAMLNLQKTLHSAASWIDKVPALFITLINTNQ